MIIYCSSFLRATWLWTLLCLGSLLHAETLILPTQAQRIDPQPYVEYLEDPGGTLRSTDFERPEVAARFRPWADSHNTMNFGFTSSTWWLRLRLKTASDTRGRWLLEIPYLHLDEIDLHAPDREVLELGASRPFEARPYFHRFHIFPLDVTSTEQVWLLRVKSADSLTLPMQIWSPDAFANESTRLFVVQAMYFGGLLALMVYNLFLASSLRDRRFLFYALFAGHFGLAMMAGNGLAHMFIWPGAYRFDQVAQSFLLALAAAFAMQFSIAFLQGGRHAPNLARSLHALTLVFTVIALLLIGSLWWPLPRQTVLIAMTLISLPAGLLTIWIGARTWRRGFKPARFFLLAWGILWAGAFVAGARMMGWIPTNVVTAYALQIASTAEMLLLALSLADLIHIERLEREKAQSLALDTQQRVLQTLKQSEDKLEKAVQQRTHELEVSLDVQKALVAQHVRFGALISHEFRNPLGILDSQVSLMRREAEVGKLDLTRRLDTMTSAMQRLQGMFDNWLKNDRLSNSLQDFRRQPVPLVAWLHELIDAQTSYHANHWLKENLTFDPGDIWMDENLMDIALTNLIDNACKYSAPGTTITITTRQRGQQVGLCVTDQGKGIAPEHHAAIFQDYFRVEPEGQVRGIGLGLPFVRRIVDLHQGQIELLSNIDEGSRFCIWLPMGPPAFTNT
jgi:signal transduction histidine kinase